MSRFSVLFLAAALLAAPLAVSADGPRDPYRHFFDETWHDFQEELEKAREENKKGVFIFFEMDECPFCHYMKDHVLNQPAVQEYFKDHFLAFSVDIEGGVEVVDFEGNTMTERDFAFREHRVRATPVMAFFDLDGEMVHRHTGRTAGPDEFLLMAQFVADGIYKDMRFTRYRREQEGQLIDR
ncbi:thioredoxin fold domain-containing protein [Ectothiorhodospiraceae bacterium 2226]|nr:thioredoxin fold domain-containing protein [Ectothiorhodospiraceae bacterium 2226]